MQNFDKFGYGMMKLRLPTLIFLGVSLCTSTKGQDTTPVRETLYGQVSGFVKESLPGKNVENFLGVPYAKPPVGLLRFEDPEPPLPWQGVLPTINVPQMCVQIDEDKSYMDAHRPGFNDSSEDCLYLNVYTPQAATGSDGPSLPVMVFVHGGSNVVGAGHMFDGDILAAYTDIVVVTFNYRLGALGFLGTSLPTFRGNFGILDQIAVLDWVQKNIENFRGDPRQVTVVGHSAGSMDVGAYLVSPLTKGLFNAIVCMSGAPISNVTHKLPRHPDPTEEVRNVSKTLGCDAETLWDIKACLKTKPAIDIMKSYPIYDWYQFPFMIDGHFLSDTPENSLQTDEIHVERFMIGTTSLEAGSWASLYPTWKDIITELQGLTILPPANVSEHVYFEYRDWSAPDTNLTLTETIAQAYSDPLMVVPSINSANVVSDRGIPTYLYLFDYRSELFSEPLLAGVPHGTDIFYLFGAPLVGHKYHNYTDLDKEMSKFLMAAMASFVNPWMAPEGRFEPYNTTTKTYLVFNADNGVPEVTLKQNPSPRAVQFWNNYLPGIVKLVNNTECSGASGVWGNVVLLGLCALLVIVQLCSII